MPIFQIYGHGAVLKMAFLSHTPQDSLVTINVRKAYKLALGQKLSLKKSLLYSTIKIIEHKVCFLFII